MTDAALTLYVVDDDEALRRSLLLLLFSQGLAVQGFDSGESFLQVLDPQRPGCVILDLRMGGMSGLAVLEQLRMRHSPLVVVFLSGHGTIPMALEAVRLGAFDWVVKPDTQQLLDKLPLAMAEARARANALVRWLELTPREREVARQVGLGHSNKEVARQLVPACSPRSVETHRANLFMKLELANDNELGRWLSRHAWLQ
ncbi:MAG: response regulator [Gammaproteobacteria bacterium]|uniref:response regulator transcription factor n=1 Tax=Rhodoferax sp. TaxID=50421 RepID=UPI0017DA08F2|nr:response regulator [Rhodoferax sp.]MBU3899435.1 response regulator [Gammaproteobacteria bacterium]MBA3057264.1 response regulator transcription factor [Rhodoferax sp.]MBU3996339.1 response regulator [Gammaproteobacteria bacterium]MBU4080690.1 response regulator [Gammaproteobacteria bacterium]MBU4113520.1 response regulator [Gammaproteobacteria bacterium]